MGASCLWNIDDRWRRAYSGLSVSQVQRLKELEKENARLKRLLAEAGVRLNAFGNEYKNERPHSRLSYLTPLEVN
jgi:hypothetical protein